NLPREKRYKKENIILVSLMPGPKEAKTSEINHYLRPLIVELKKLYLGVVLSTNECPSSTLIYAALLLIACDIPTARKTCGFTSHASINACHICNCHISCRTDGKDMNYSGLVFSEWVSHTNEKHCRDAEKWRRARSEAEKMRLERENDVRWSELLELKYFNAVECTIINPMHNLFLGTAK
ncbi:hypothetical protein PHYBLDRAFT_102157, partial [Phycomyces blakesleeanus NRRL 1555(-)]